MSNKKLYIISGPNGAGKTTASFEFLPDLLDCKEFINADEIARGLSPFQPEKVAFEAGRIMLARVRDLMGKGEVFAFETTLATKSFVKIIEEAKQKDYQVYLVFFYLKSPILAQQRVAKRVKEGGHNIPSEVIERRYSRGLYNLMNHYFEICDVVMVIDNSDYFDSKTIIEKNAIELNIYNDLIYKNIKAHKNE